MARRSPYARWWSAIRLKLATALVASLLVPASALAVRGDFNGDRIGDIAVGSRGEDIAAVGADTDGAVHAAYGSATGLDPGLAGGQLFTQSSPGMPGDGVDGTTPGDAFGATLAEGDFNGDHRIDLAIGSPFEDVATGSNDRNGAVHVLYGRGAGLVTARSRVFTQSTRSLKGDGPETLDLFGSKLAAGDFDDDGRDDLAIGVPDEGISAGSRAGVLHVLYGGRKGVTTKRDQIFHQDRAGMAGDGAEAQDLFGNSLASGDFNRDGADDLAVAATLENADADNDGAVHVLDGGRGGLSTRGDQFFSQNTPGVPSDGAQDGDIYGAALATGDFDLDRRDDLVVGIPFEGVPTIGANDRDGALSVLFGSRRGIGFTRNQYFTQETAGVPGSESAEAGDRFGFTLETGRFNADGATDLAVTAIFEHVNGTGAGQHGAVHVMYGGGPSPGGPGSGGGLFLHQDVSGVEDVAQTGDRFGSTLAASDVAGDGVQDLIVGVPDEDILAVDNDEGIVQLFLGTDSGIGVAGDFPFDQGATGLPGDDPEPGDRFGDALP